MSKTVRVSDETHDELERRATAEHRTLSGVVEALLARTRATADLTPLGIEITGREPLVGSVAKKNEGRRVPMVEGQRFEVGDVPVLTIPAPRIGRAPETPCGRCRVPWKNHQEGSRKNRAGTTGCTTFEDPS